MDDESSSASVIMNKHAVQEILLTTGKLKAEGKLRSTSAHCANRATARRTAHEVRRSRDTDKPVHKCMLETL